MNYRENEKSTCYEDAGGVSYPLQSLVSVQLEAIRSVMCDPSIGVEWLDPAHQNGGGANVLIGHFKH